MRATHHRRRAAAAVTFLAGLVLAAGCTPDAPQPTPSAAALLPPPAVRALRSGTLYLLAGPAPNSANVWRVDVAEKRVTQVTSNPAPYGVSWISASRAGVVLADARSGVDMLSVLEHDRVRQLPEGHVVTPAMDDNGRVAYVRPPDQSRGIDPDKRKPFLLELKPSVTSPAKIFYRQRDPDMGGLAWGPRGLLAVTSASGPHRPAAGPTPEILVLDADGEITRRLRSTIRELGAPVWGPRAPGIAVAGYRGRGTVLTLDGEETLLPPGWNPACWNPSGKALLLVNNNELALWRPDRPDAVSAIGSVQGGSIFGCSWLH